MADVAGSAAKRDSRKLVKTKPRGIYRRTNADGSLGAYAVIYRAGGRQRRECADTVEAARRIKRARESDRDRGEWQERPTLALHAYLTQWSRFGNAASRRAPVGI